MPERKCPQAGGAEALKRTITYSRNVFLPVTDLCRNRCGYCSFWRDSSAAALIDRRSAIRLIEEGVVAGCSESLFSMGDRPWEARGFAELARKSGIDDLIGYLQELSEISIEAGLLPHTNAGVLNPEEMARLAPYNASMGLMLETVADVPMHRGSPGKVPDERLKHIRAAGRLKIPFTTGILVGIGESPVDRMESLEAIALMHRRYGHIQEVIIQGLDPKAGTEAGSLPSPSTEDLLGIVVMARRILPVDVAIQVPPNLVDPAPFVDAGASDLGGISTVTPDWINPERPWPSVRDLEARLSGYTLKERLPIYPGFVRKGWYGRKTANLIRRLAGPDGLRAAVST